MMSLETAANFAEIFSGPTATPYNKLFKWMDFET